MLLVLLCVFFLFSADLWDNLHNKLYSPPDSYNSWSGWRRIVIASDIWCVFECVYLCGKETKPLRNKNENDANTNEDGLKWRTLTVKSEANKRINDNNTKKRRKEKQDWITSYSDISDHFVDYLFPHIRVQLFALYIDRYGNIYI